MSLLNEGCNLAFLGFSPGPMEMLVILAVALLLYGGRLPEMARSWGKTLAEFRRGLSGIQNDLNDAMYSTPEQADYYPEQLAAPYSDDTVDEYRGDIESYDADYYDGEETTEEGTTTEAATVETTEEDSSEAASENPAEEPSSKLDSD